MRLIRVQPLIDDPEAVRAITEYWAQNDDLTFTNKVGVVAAALGIRSRDVARLVTQFSRAYVPEWPCTGCGGIRPLASRAEYTGARSGRYVWNCGSCAERFAAEYDAARQSKVREHYPGIPADRSEPRGLVDRVLLLSLVRTGGIAGDGTVGPLAEANPPLSPTAYEDRRILARLHEHGHIAIDPASDSEAFDWDEDDQPEQFDPLLVRWRVVDVPLVSAGPERVREALPTSPTERDEAALLRLCRSLLVQECFQFLGLVLERNHLPFFPGRGTRELFEKLVEDFSVAQVYNLIWRSAREVIEYSATTPITPRHAGATIVHEISRKAEFTLARGIKLKPYRRVWGAPRSRLAEVVFDLLLDLGEETVFHTSWRSLQMGVGAAGGLAIGWASTHM